MAPARSRNSRVLRTQWPFAKSWALVGGSHLFLANSTSYTRGHLRLFRFAAENADFLVVAALPDADDGVTVPAELRLDNLRAINIVNHACILEGAAEDFIAELRPDVVVKGKEYEDRGNPEADAVETYGGRLLFSSGEVRFSSLQLIQREYYETDFSNIHKPRDYPSRHGFNFKDLRNTIAKFAGLKVLVVGDLIVDTYVTCDPIGMSQEDPTIVVTPIEQKTFLGGRRDCSGARARTGGSGSLLDRCGQ